jgi:hypothetical protein
MSTTQIATRTVLVEHISGVVVVGVLVVDVGGGGDLLVCCWCV